MKKSIKRVFYVAGIIAAFVTAGCTDKIDPEITELEFSRLLSPTGLDVRVMHKTSVRLNWSDVRNATSYTVEFFENGVLDFSGTPVKTLTGVLFSQLPLTIPGFGGETSYSVRVKAVGDEIEVSKWVSATFTTDPEHIFIPVNPDEIKSNEVILRWPAGEFATHIELTPGNITHTVTAANIQAGAATITGLTGETTYTARLMNGNKVRGTLVFTTYLDLTGTIQVNPTDNLNAVIQAAPSGAVLALHPGEYTAFQGDILINKSLTIRGALPHRKPVINVRFVIRPGVTNLVIRDIEMDGAYGAIVMHHAIWVDQHFPGIHDINSIEIIGCVVRDYNRALINDGNGPRVRVETLRIYNSVMSNILSVGGDFIDFRAAGHLANLRIEKSTFNNIASAPTAAGGPRDFIRMDNSSVAFPGSTSNIVIDRCTFFNVSGIVGTVAGRRILFVRYPSNNSNVTRSIFAGSSGYNGYFTNQPATTQPVCDRNNYFNAPWFLGGAIIDGKFDNSGTHTTLDPGFVDAAAGNFKVTNLDLIFRGIGDPRWLQ